MSAPVRAHFWYQWLDPTAADAGSPQAAAVATICQPGTTTPLDVDILASRDLSVSTVLSAANTAQITSTSTGIIEGWLAWPSAYSQVRVYNQTLNLDQVIDVVPDQSVSIQARPTGAAITVGVTRTDIRGYSNLKSGSDWYPAIVQAVTDIGTGGELFFGPGTYLTGTAIELLATDPLFPTRLGLVTFRAAPTWNISYGAIIQATGAMTEVVLMDAGACIDGVNIDGNSLAVQAIVCQGKGLITRSNFGNGTTRAFLSSIAGATTGGRIENCIASQGAGGTEGVKIVGADWEVNHLRISAPNGGVGLNVTGGWGMYHDLHITGKGTGTTSTYAIRCSAGSNLFSLIYPDTFNTMILLESAAARNSFRTVIPTNVSATVGNPIIKLDNSGGANTLNEFDAIMVVSQNANPSYFWESSGAGGTFNTLGLVVIPTTITFGTGLFNSATIRPYIKGPFIDNAGVVYGYQPVGYVALNDGANVASTWLSYDHFTLTTANSRTFSAPTGMQPGQTGTYQIHNGHATNNITPLWNAVFKLDGASGPTIAAGKDCCVNFRYDGTSFWETSRTGDVG